MRTIFTCFLFLLISNCFSQQNFLINEGSAGSNEEFFSVAQTTDGHYVALGYTTVNNADSDIYIVKVDGYGSVIWTKTISGGGYNEGYSVISTSDGGFVLSGSVNNKMAILKFDAPGNLQWTKQYEELNQSIGHSMIQTTDGGFLISGGISNDNAAQAYLVKTDASGNVQWSKKYFSASGHSVITDLKKTTDDNYIFLSVNSKHNDSTYIVKVDDSGNILWSKYFSDPDSRTDGYSILPTTGGGYLISGTRRNQTTDGFLLKLNLNGNRLWAKTTNTDGTANVSFKSSVIGNGGGYATLGSAVTPDSNFYYLVKTDDLGNLTYAKTLKKANNDLYGAFYTSITTREGGYIAAGSVIDASGFLDGQLMKLDFNLSSCKPTTGTYGSLIDYGTLATGLVDVADGNTDVSSDEVSTSATGGSALICTALPLSLVSFTGELHQNTVQLKWQTSEEINTGYFNVEKSQDGKLFNAFTKVPAAGNSAGIHNYSTTDNNPFAGQSWYRLKMVDKDGEYTYSNTVAINNNNAGRNAIFINPNPVSNLLNLTIQSLSATSASIQIVDMNGKLLMQKTCVITEGTNKIPFNVTGFTKGTYILKVIQNNNAQNLKWVKQ